MSSESLPFADAGPVCCVGECCGAGSYCCARAGQHTHDDTAEGAVEFFAPARRLRDAVQFTGGNADDCHARTHGFYSRSAYEDGHEHFPVYVRKGDWLWVFANGDVEVHTDAPLTVRQVEWGTVYNEKSHTSDQLAAAFPLVKSERQARAHAERCAPYQDVARREHLSDGSSLPWRVVPEDAGQSSHE